MNFNGDEGSVISLREAITMTKRFRDSAPIGTVLSQTLGNNKLLEIMNQVGCVAVRFYSAKNESGVMELVAVGVDSNGEDLYNGIILDRTVHCPPVCPGSSPLSKD